MGFLYQKEYGQYRSTWGKHPSRTPTKTHLFYQTHVNRNGR